MNISTQHPGMMEVAGVYAPISPTSTSQKAVPDSLTHVNMIRMPRNSTFIEGHNLPQTQTNTCGERKSHHVQMAQGQEEQYKTTFIHTEFKSYRIDFVLTDEIGHVCEDQGGGPRVFGAVL
jgi:hypothetical protein